MVVAARSRTGAVETCGFADTIGPAPSGRGDDRCASRAVPPAGRCIGGRCAAAVTPFGLGIACAATRLACRCVFAARRLLALVGAVAAWLSVDGWETAASLTEGSETGVSCSDDL